jgi:anti-sigma B factor antagonist
MVQPTKFAIASETRGETQALLLAGELDLSNVSELAERVNNELDRPISTLILDLSELTFMDSTGLRLLIELDQRATREEWTLTLIPSLHESTNTILRLTGADAALPFEGPPA